MSVALLTKARKRTGAGAFALGAALLLGGCSSNPPAPVVDLSSGAPQASERGSGPRAATAGATYRVVRGDTLYAIAFRNGLDFRELAAWNAIEPPYRIYAGQDLRLGPPSAQAATSRVATAAAPAVPARAPTAPAPAASPGPAPQNGKRTTGSGMFEDVPATTQAPAAVEPASPPASPQAMPSTVVPATAPATPPKSQVAEQQTKPAAETAPKASGEAPVNGAAGVVWRWPGKGALIGSFVAGDQTRQGIDIAGTAGDPVLAAADGEVVYSGNGLLGYGELIIVKHNASFLSAYGHNRKRLVQEGDRVRGGQQIAEMGSSASARDELHFEIRRNGKPVNPLDYLPPR
ncbi:MAG TPA: peptidoglycan DD-metalloendopeptidase family protein [Rudaea sp.]|nr:peptidoglycan DD-metalloendopeptidase family protein [Rudaea sp.]